MHLRSGTKLSLHKHFANQTSDDGRFLTKIVLCCQSLSVPPLAKRLALGVCLALMVVLFVAFGDDTAAKGSAALSVINRVTGLGNHNEQDNNPNYYEHETHPIYPPDRYSMGAEKQYTPQNPELMDATKRFGPVLNSGRQTPISSNAVDTMKIYDNNTFKTATTIQKEKAMCRSKKYYCRLTVVVEKPPHHDGGSKRKDNAPLQHYNNTTTVVSVVRNEIVVMAVLLALSLVVILFYYTSHFIRWLRKKAEL